MTKIIEGKLTAKGKKFGVVISRFNELISVTASYRVRRIALQGTNANRKI